MRRKGQASVEFALVATLFLLLVTGTFDLARAYLAYTVVSNVAREAARYGAVHRGEPGWQTSAQQAGLNLAIGVDTGSLAFTSVADRTINGQQFVAVSATYTFHSVTPLIGNLIGNPITMVVDTAALAG